MVNIKFTFLILCILILISVNVTYKDKMISMSIFTKGIMNNLKTTNNEIDLLNDMSKCLHKNVNFYQCANKLDIKKKQHTRKFRKTKFLKYLDTDDTKDLELHNF